MNSARHTKSVEMVAKITKGNLTSSIFMLAVPMIIANTFSVFLELTDAFFVGQLGSEPLAAVSLAGMVIFFLATFGIGLSIGIVAMVSRSFGQQDYEMADRIVVQAFYLGIIISAVIGIFGYLFSPHLLVMLGAKGQVLDMGVSYLRVLFAGIFTMFLMFLVNAVFQGIGDTVSTMKIWGVTTIINVALNPVLIFGFLGAPRMGVAGSATATVIARTVGCVLMMYVLLKKEKHIHIKKEHLAVDFAIIKKIFIIGVPGSIQMVLRSFSMVVLIKIAALFGNVVVATYGVGGRLFHLFLFPGFAMGGAAATMVGQCLGAKNPQRAIKAARMSAEYYFLFLVVCGALVFFFARQIAGLFNPEPDFINTASVYFRYIAVSALFLSTGVVYSQAMQGAGKTIKPMLITAVTIYLIQVPLAFFLSSHFNLKEHGIWIATLTGLIFQGIIMFYVFNSDKDLGHKVYKAVPIVNPAVAEVL